MTRTCNDLAARHRFVLAVARLVLTLRHIRLVARFVKKTGYLPNPAAPRRYHEMMLWRKIIDRNPLFVTFSDKLAAKAYIRAAYPELRMPATLWSGHDPNDIPSDLLATGAVVKANHGCAMNVFVSDGRPDRTEIVRKARRWLGKRHGKRDGEWAYWPINPTLFVEERLTLSGGTIATDIKVHVCSGVICHIWVEDKQAGRSHLFDGDGMPLPGRDPDYPREDQALTIGQPIVDHVRQAAAIARRVAGDLDHIRVDFLVTDDQLYIGEMVVYTAAGYATWTNPVITDRLETYWRLERSAYLKGRHRGIGRLYAEALRAWFAVREAGLAA
ncbi:ATP-grasp fold amidoligase family protein [Mesorhizobium sp.]|uniref:ATP-grasp fold amidoligase family protein n=1 Tax=Mesorhizobium sp. TaxID=1871066 RepID=UPI0025F5A194|nr:ATP-grasp fold amidoligase family protein [Mesorhizobium sp.]